MRRSRWIEMGLGCVLCSGTMFALQAQQPGYGPPPQQQAPQQQQQGYGTPQQQSNYGPPQQGYGPPQQGQNYGPPPQGPGGWDAPPPDFSPIGRQGFQDGVRAAREDFRAGRPFAVTRNPYYRHPPVQGPARNEYRDAFQRGYDRVMRHRGDGPPPPPPGQYYPH